ncbi:replicative DNA helicase [Bacillus mesophilum]|uniref:Replicative DNA helicase n=1 Tax=Bacillus mesophilum TaxID=1071718 RepID=A0A7V7RP29_9BACI|nr:replicative DNA helicase [Bacillus mesophilum]KAB2334288.1 replicative DNA helicase [Bacillus mesophilum]
MQTATEDLLLFNLEAEQFFLGIMLTDPDLLKVTRIKPHHLSPGKHYNLLWALQDLDVKGIQIDAVSILERVGHKADRIGGASYLNELRMSVPTTANYGFYEKVLLEYWQKREAVQIANKIKEASMNDDPAQVIQTGINELMQLEDISGDDDDGSIKDVLHDIYENLSSPSGDLTGIPSGFAELDRMTSGFQKQDLVIIAARPSVGKTAFCLNIAQQVSQNDDYAVGIFSLEMSMEMLLMRMLSSSGNIDAQNMRTRKLADAEWTKLTYALGKVSNMNLNIFDKPGVTVNEIWAKARKMKRFYGERKILIIIDYLQLITGSAKHRGNRTQEISEISRMLKHMARELDVCVIALSQLSRAVEQRQDKRPMMSDIRESGQIEQDADVIGFLYRDDYYNKDSEDKNIIEIIIGKQRNGPTGTVQLAFVKEYGSFVNLERRYDR